MTIYRHHQAEVDAIEMTDPATTLEWLRPGEYNFVSREMVITWYAGDWYRCYFGLDYLIRTPWGVRPETKVHFEANYLPLTLEASG